MTDATRYRVKSVERALTLLDTLGEAGPEGMTLTELSRALSVSKSTAYAILSTMRSRGFVADSGSGMQRRYRLGIALARLGDLVASQHQLRDVAMPVLHLLTEETGLTSRVAILDENYAVAIGRVEARQGVVRFAANLGRPEHLHNSAVGKAMLSHLPDEAVLRIAGVSGLPAKTAHTIVDTDALLRDLATARRRGYAIDDEEDNDGVFCVGSAVCDHHGHCLGAISVTGLKLDLPAWKVEQLGETVREHAERISAEFGAPVGAANLGGAW
jgi:IclR family transcriptional regulator, acetate operon repressor